MYPTLQQFREASAKQAKQFYADIPYHNFKHAQNVEGYTMQIVQLLWLDMPTQFGMSHGGRMHDTLYHQPLAPGFASKEDVSISVSNTVAELIAFQLWLDGETKEHIIRIAADGIEATKIPCEDFSTEPRKILRAADVQHLWTADSEQFMRDTALIYHEYSQLNEAFLREKNWWPLPIDLFQEKQAEILESLVQKMIGKIPEAPYFPVGFYENYTRNVEQLKVIDFKKYL
jgi:hypothetical protein